VGTVNIWRRLTTRLGGASRQRTRASRWPSQASRWRGRTSRRRGRTSRWRGRTSRWRGRTSRRPAAEAGPALRWPVASADGSQAFSALLACGTHRIADTDFVVVDLETTGWSPDTARITEIGAVRFTGGRVTGEFCTLINPGQAIPADIAALTGISDAMVARAPVIGAVLPDFLAFAGGAVLTAHNAPFDVSFLIAACGDCGLPWPDLAVLDTVTLARQVLGETEVPDCKLSTLASFFQTPTVPSHRALADARATAAVLHGLIGRLAASGVRTLAEISV
jgi:DNA polymerase-3 subunit epsilon